MRANIAMFLAGILFAIGLSVAGMTQPQRIIGFLDVFGQWDPSLLFVMFGAVVFNFFMFRLVLKRPNPLFASRFYVPDRRDIDARLLVGSAIFGIGWGLGGFCPGPGLVSLVTGTQTVLMFVGAMIVGVVLQAKLKRN